MNKLRISTKLFAVFFFVICLAVANFFLSYLGMKELNRANDHLHSYNTMSINYIGSISTNYQQQRVLLRDVVLFFDDEVHLESILNMLDELDAEMEGLLVLYGDSIDLDGIDGQQDYENFYAFVDYYETGFHQTREDVHSAAMKEDFVAVKQIIMNAQSIAENNSELLSTCVAINTAQAEATMANGNALFDRYSTIQLILVLVSVVLVLGMSVVMELMTSRPLSKIAEAADKLAKGDLDIQIEQYARPGKDEVATLARAFSGMVDGISEQTELLSSVAEGDLTIPGRVRSEKDTLGQGIVSMATNLNQVMSEIAASAGQVAQGASQISSGSQMLAQGSSEQASAVEQLSTSIYEISINTRQSAEKAERAATLYASMREHVNHSSELVAQTIDAVDKINEASANISKISKLINSISFQTNILALNAAVEAASSGQYGKGFAVVADEIRALANKTADSAKSINLLIEDTQEKAADGMRIAEDTSKDLNSVINEIIQSSRLLEEIAMTTREQAVSIEQVNNGIEQVAQIITVNSVAAERSATASEQMAGQVDSLYSLVKRFKVKGGVTPGEEPAAVPVHISEKPAAPRPVIILDNDFGKY